ncbi:phage antirepressor KilAC domain-containing protein [uncultured Alistipes sp.]|uniref:phage antirepressor KilAC domain-containing protein n=1 Tax=uncultured Alistipes sp. TaxID=538949 RepID=UPI0025F41C26|nr:phage antirepressor KilAC domain-containing protein [uncultured Alistipes sp.]
MEQKTISNATGVQIFKNPQFGQLRTAGTSECPLFAATDLCRMLGYSNTSKAINDHTEPEERYNVSLERGGKMLFITESGLYALIFRSNKPDAKGFRKWVTSEVLPTIRKTGGYIPANEGESEIDIMAKALLIAQRQIEAQRVRAEYEAARAEALQKQTEKMQGQIDYINERQKKLIPAAAYTNEVLQSKSDYTLTQTAHALGFRSVYVLTGWLNRRGVLYFQSGQWQPTAKVAAKGYFSTRTHKRISSDDTIVTKIYTTVTEKGRRFLWEMLHEDAAIFAGE